MWLRNFNNWIGPERKGSKNRAKRDMRRRSLHRWDDLETRILPAAVIVAAAPNLETTEAGGTAHFSVKLDTQPTSDVTIRVRSSNPQEGTPAVSQLVFTATNWDAAQVVTVTGVDDAIDDDDAAYFIILDKLKTKDKNFKNRIPAIFR